MINGTQIRMAIAALKWGVRELADKAGLNPNTVSRIETGGGIQTSSLEKIEAALIDGGVLFIEQNGGGPGVRLKGNEE